MIGRVAVLLTFLAPRRIWYTTAKSDQSRVNIHRHPHAAFVGHCPRKGRTKIYLQRGHATHPASCLAAALPSVDAETTSKTTHSNSKGKGVIKNPSYSKEHQIDNEFIDEMENIPVGHLSKENKRKMLLALRRLTSIDQSRHGCSGGSSNESFDLNSLARQRRQNASMAERLSERLLQEQDYEATQINTKYAPRTYNFAIKAWSNANVRGSAEKAEKILSKVVKSSNKSTPRPDIYSFAYCYAAWYRESVFASTNIGNSKASTSALFKADEVLKAMKQSLFCEEQSASSANTVQDVNSLLILWSSIYGDTPDLVEKFLLFVERESRDAEYYWVNTQSFNLVINAWAKSGCKDSILRSEILLRELENNPRIKPNVLSYSGVITCIAKSKESNVAKRAEAVLSRMEERKELGSERPDNVIFNQIINLYSKCGSEGSALHCEKLLNRMMTLAAEGNSQVVPDVRTYNLVLSAWANEHGPTEAEKVLERLENHEGLRPNAISYITCMDAYAAIGDVQNCLRVLSMMEKAFKNGNVDSKPTRRAYTSALNALSKSGRGDAGLRAEELVQTMERLYRQGNEDLQPDTTVYNVLINCHKNSATRAEKILYKMGERDVVSYSSVINAYSKMGGVEAARKAQALLDEMQKHDVMPNAQVFNSAITAWGRSGCKGAASRAESLLKQLEQLYEEGNESLRPTAQVYTSVISAWAKSDEPGAALRAEILLKLMRVMYKRGNKSMKPNAFTYTSCINAWARSGETNAGERAEALLDQMIELYQNGDEEVKPNVLSFTAAMNAHSRNGGRNAAAKANNLFLRMESLGVKPNLPAYNVLIAAWGNSQQQGAAKIAENILIKLEHQSESGNTDMRPNVVSYSSAINAWAKSTESGKARRALAVLERMKKMNANGFADAKPNIVSYTSCLNACATTCGNQEEEQEAFRIAYSLFKELSDDGSIRPNHITYLTFFRAIAKLIPHSEKRESLLSTSFRLCCQDGQVDENCFFHLKNTASSELFSELMGSSDLIQYSELPFHWKRNVSSTPKAKNRIRREIH
ncbi:hypothetical protein HJC23_012496 [Cyclotella cryptica]|uniref:Pentacotripeptide-repeat region of PRORP domain-containing protein n=1 Tax=Cyclotella cryptica TaxID=29204 RepID=A0ABD3PBI3_9STRA|eukprot:CCRYP_016296-RA/>CCRYP_016296-RA protein AED:0.04 eAED:0.04 QI:309/1/1/1/0.71/0.62/8/1927/1041